MFNKKGFIILSSISLIILSACNNRGSFVQPLQESSIVTQQSVEKESKYYGSAQDSIWIAESTARTWDISAELIKAEANWIEENGKSNWTYYFKSPFKPNILKVDFTGFSQEVPNTFFGSEIRDWDWKIDSGRAISIAKQQGLRNFPVIQMSLEKRFDTEWYLSTYNGIFRINAETGKLVSKSLKK